MNILDFVFNNGWQITQTGIAGVMLGMVWNLMVKKDNKIYDIIEKQENERKQVYENLTELVKEVTTALVSKNLTDDRLSDVVHKLAEQMREIKAILIRESQNDKEE